MTPNDEFTRWWILLSKIPYMGKEEIARRAWSAAYARMREKCANECEKIAYSNESTQFLGPEINSLKCAAAIRSIGEG